MRLIIILGVALILKLTWTVQSFKKMVIIFSYFNFKFDQ